MTGDTGPVRQRAARQRRLWVAVPVRLCVLLVSASCMLSCGPLARHGGDPPPATTALLGDTGRIALEPYQGRLRAVRVRAAGRGWQLLFDTGGGTTLVSPALAQALGCAPRGRMTGHRMSGEAITMPTCAPGTLTIGGWSASPQTLGVFDVMSLLPRDWPRVDGVVSLRSFAGHRVTLDLAANVLVVHDTRAEPDLGAFRLAGRIATGASGAELLALGGVTVGVDTLWFLVDSGNLDAVLLAPHAARLLGMADSVGTEQPQLALSLVPRRPSTVRARVRSLILDGALNAAWLEQGRLTMDLVDGRLWWMPHAPASRR